MQCVLENHSGPSHRVPEHSHLPLGDTASPAMSLSQALVTPLPGTAVTIRAGPAWPLLFGSLSVQINRLNSLSVNYGCCLQCSERHCSVTAELKWQFQCLNQEK